MIATIIDAGRTSSGKLVDYLLRLEDGSEIRMTSNEIKSKIQAGEMTVAGMQLDAAGRLVKAPQEKRAAEKTTVKPAKSEPKPEAKKPVPEPETDAGEAEEEESGKEEAEGKTTGAAEVAKSVAAKSKSSQGRTSKRAQKSAPAKPVVRFEPLKDVEVKQVSEEEKKKAKSDGKPRAFVKRIV